MQDLLEHISVNLTRPHRNWRLDYHQAQFPQVCEEYPDHAKRQVNVRRDIYHRRRRLRIPEVRRLAERRGLRGHHS